MSLVVKLLAGLMILVVAAIPLTAYLQRRLMYFPDPRRLSPASAGLATVSEVEFPAADGTIGLAWHGAAAPGKPTLLYFHGNAGALETRSERIRKYMARGYGMFMMTYRGFGGRGGAPSERGNVADAMAAYDALVAGSVAPSQIILYGESLGSGVAVQVAGAKQVAGIILDAPYTSMVDMAALHHPMLPVRLFMTDRYDTRKHVSAVTAPILIVHGEKDELIPVAMGRELHALARAPKTIVTFPEAGHSDHYMFGSYDAIYAWLEAQADRARIPAADGPDDVPAAVAPR